ncbi:hypothetical protein KAR91_01550 [Candidatus Pacearchaeota archaeon]|nr:hypothetical protein [Candidatus Pacearchaeota archaeon]
MSLGTMPESIPIKSLESPGTEYNSEKLKLYDALYEGGTAFRHYKETFLPQIAIETVAKSGSKHYEARLNSAFYTNYVAGLLDWLSAKIVENNPRIVVGESATISEESREYWLGLNDNADGKGNKLITICKMSALEILVKLRSYFCVNFSDKASKDGKICLFDAITVDDWQKDLECNLSWIRRNTMELGRDATKLYLPPTTEQHYWTFYDDKQVVIYVAERPIGKQTWPKDAVATRSNIIEHDFGLPIFDVRADKSLWVMDRLSEPVEKLFRRQSALCFYLDALAVQMLRANLEFPDQWDAVPITPMGMIALGLDEDIGYFGPDAAGFGPNFKAVEEDKKSLYESLQILSRDASALPQAGRLSGDAVEAMQKPMNILLSSYGWAIDSALTRLVDQLKEHRGEQDQDIRVAGFEYITVEDSEIEEIKNSIIKKEIGEGDDDERRTESRRSAKKFGTVREKRKEERSEERRKERERKRQEERELDSENGEDEFENE